MAGAPIGAPAISATLNVSGLLLLRRDGLVLLRR